VVLPFDYTRLLFAALIGYTAFGEVPDTWTWIGAAVIAASAVYIAHREAVRSRATTAAEAAEAAERAL
jgi:drug/metabolite transporter (DMT)-like permease